jgi:hypothetical protein
MYTAPGIAIDFDEDGGSGDVSSRSVVVGCGEGPCGVVDPGNGGIGDPPPPTHDEDEVVVAAVVDVNATVVFVGEP